MSQSLAVTESQVSSLGFSVSFAPALQRFQKALTRPCLALELSSIVQVFV